jgi:hypothetical protein
MKIETIIKTFGVTLVVFILAMTLVGSIIMNYAPSGQSVDNSLNLTKLQDQYKRSESGLQNNTLEKDNNKGQSEREPLYADSFYIYQGKALSALFNAEFGLTSIKEAILNIGAYLYVNPMILAGIISFIMISVAFALISWWRGRRP